MTIFKHCSINHKNIIIIDKCTVGNLNNIDIHERIVTFVHILSSFNWKITLIAKIYIVIFMV